MSSTRPATADILRSFRNILNLEGERDYPNTTVQGGLDRFIERNSTELAAALSDPLQAGELLKAPYARMDLEQRRQWASHWLALLEERSTAVATTAASSTPEVKNGGSQATEGSLPQMETSRPRPSPVGRRGRHRAPYGLTLDSPVDRLPYVGKRIAAQLNRLGVGHVRELLYLFPRRHNDFSRISTVSQLVPGEEQTVIATVWQAEAVRLGRGKRRDTEAVLGDETGNLKAVWFGQPHVARILSTNARVVLSGRVDLFRGTPVFESPEYEVLDRRQASGVHTGRLVPVYPLTEGLSPRTLRRIVWTALDLCTELVQDFLPQSVLETTGLMALPESITQSHYPDTLEVREAARRRLAFDEFFLLQMAVLMQRHQRRQSATGISLQAQRKLLDTFLESVPFELTGAQQRSLSEILADLEKGTPPMSRLLQGEVGSGKTVVALAALLVAAANGYQSAIMAPTEILAEQHFRTVSRLLEGLARPVQEENLLVVYVDPCPRPISLGLLTGSMSSRAKEEMRTRLAEGALDIAIGTHTLIQESVEIPNLALAVVDEQHRFGVLQRASLRERGDDITPHVLAMSATPIPRTLALTIYGDLDISTIDELPPGRQKVVTRWVPPDKRNEAYQFLRKQINNGRQAFVICPLIEESEVLQVKAATEEYERLSQHEFPDLRLGLLHGRMPARDKDQAMEQFLSRQVDILVSTPVVEVGIDVPNATVMLVEGADRFGLSQLHQFRGRVGRGEHKSYCLVLAENPSEVARERLLALERIHDGFELAEVDLSLRGPGEYFGTRQSGFPNLKMARLSDRDLLTLARQQASALLEEDSQLTRPEHVALAPEVARFVDKVSGEVS